MTVATKNHLAKSYDFDCCLYMCWVQKPHSSWPFSVSCSNWIQYTQLHMQDMQAYIFTIVVKKSFGSQAWFDCRITSLQVQDLLRYMNVKISAKDQYAFPPAKLPWTCLAMILGRKMSPISTCMLDQYLHVGAKKRRLT